MVQILRGFNIPVRKNEHTSYEDRDNAPTVRSYVEVSFQEQKARTQIFEGPSPHWNETIFLEVKPPNNDFRPESLLDSEVGMERIYFHIFDETLIDIIEDDRNREVEIHQRRERNWLGSFSMPFTALYEQTKIEGSFHVKVPVVLLGYEKNAYAGSLENAMFLALDATKESLVDIFITLEPPLAQPAPLKLKFLSDESDRLLRYATHWCKPPFRHPTRTFYATTLDLSGRTTFICRFIRPQEPPPELLTPRHLLRYVSSIPYLPDRTAFSADVSLWATSDQMLELRAGDATEHAVLLCNFLMAKGGGNIDVYVVLGIGIPEGRTAYVAMKGKQLAAGIGIGIGGGAEITLMNAVTGESYSVRDMHLPLKYVWANIQTHDDPPRINWNISDPKKWKPFFCKSFPKTEYKSVQIEKLIYRDLSARYCEDLSVLIENAIVSKIEEWRGHRITRWNRLVGKKNLHPLVSRMESDFLQPLPPNTPQHLTPIYQALAELKTTYRISGFPLQATFTDIKAIVELVGATDVHMNADPSAEFALSVCLTRGKGELLY
ncbi:Coiled-coil and C2 domain-containing protein 2A [Physocladia obscura]|uniref:Coiled-coil and C2 domain-containing protein 2A n=1 Tax=Physocladia obscura TaxID=109957 RepID=A0AAD5SW90_9FUNG|nr:Coiled-coil and C2 domain-containing protein 2A [Physocladia obscura]